MNTHRSRRRLTAARDSVPLLPSGTHGHPAPPKPQRSAPLRRSTGRACHNHASEAVRCYRAVEPCAASLSRYRRGRGRYSSQITSRSSQFTAHCSQLTAHSSQLAARVSRLAAHSSKLIFRTAHTHSSHPVKPTHRTAPATWQQSHRLGPSHLSISPPWRSPLRPPRTHHVTAGVPPRTVPPQHITFLAALLAVLLSVLLAHVTCAHRSG